MIRFHHSDCIEWARREAALNTSGFRFHALLCDPPYHLQSIVKRFGAPGAAAARPGRDGAFARVSRGFMGQTWDGGEISFDPKTWAAFLPLLHPGAFGVAFSSPRTCHRMAVAIEDAGYILHPTIFGWAYSSGLPKAHKVKDDPRLAGHRYGLQTLKPGLEPILIFQKPYEGRPLSNIQETGAGTLNIDGTRIPGKPYVINRYDGLRPFGGGDGPYQAESMDSRWASNFVLLDPGAADRLGESAEFFFQVAEQFDSADPLYYGSKASLREKESGLDAFPADEKGRRNPHPSVKPLSLCKWLATLLLPPADFSPRRLFVPFSGVGSEAIGADLSGWEEVEGVELTADYIPIAEARADYWSRRENR